MEGINKSGENLPYNEINHYIMKYVKAEEQHFVDDLAVWRHKIRGVKHAVLPPKTLRPNPLVLDDLVIASVFSPGMVYAVEKASGNPRWRFRLNGLGSESATSAFGMVYGMSSHTLYAVDAVSGKARWEFCPYGTKREYMYSSPAITGSRLFLGDRAGRFHCLNAKTGKHLWWKETSRARNKAVNSTAIFYGGLIIIATNASVAIAYEPRTGKQVWRQRIDGPSHELHIFKKQVLVQTESSVYLLHPHDGKIQNRFTWRGERIWKAVIADDMLVIVSQHKRILSHPLEAYKRGEIMRCIKKMKIIYEQQTSSGIIGYRWSHKARLLYESQIEGLGIIDVHTGDRIHNIKSKKYHLHPGIVDVQGKLIYLLTMNGTLYALRLP